LVSYNTRSTQKSGNKCYVKIILFNNIFYALADTGSPVTLISSKIIPKNLLQNLTHTNLSLVGANGTKLDILGNLKVNISFPNEATVINTNLVVVQNLCETILIGSDFLTANSCIINFKDLSLSIGNIKVPLLESVNDKLTKSFSVKIARSIKIPPRTTVSNIKCDLHSKNKSNKKCYITTSGIFWSKCDRFNITAQDCLTNFHKGNGYVTVTNPHDNEIIIYKNQRIGEFEKVCHDTINQINQIPLNQELHTTTSLSTNNITSLNQDRIHTLYNKLNLDKLHHLGEQNLQELKRLISEFHHIFFIEGDQLPEAKLQEHEIILDTNKIIRTPFRQIPMAYKPEAERIVHDLAKLDVIEPSNSPYHSPAFIIKRGTKFRLVVDYRQVNKHVIRSYQPLPTIDTITTIWNNCKYWSTLDLHHAYFQAPLKESSRPYTACSIPGIGSWQFKRIPAGISSAPGYFQSQIERIFLGLKHTKVVCYMDDLATGSTDFKSMMKNLRCIFQRLNDAKLLLKPEKTKLFQEELLYLGFKLSEKGLQVNPEKTEAITKMMPPNNKRQLKSFIAFCSFFRKFIKSFCDIVRPQSELLKKDNRFVWDKPQQESFDLIKQKLIQAPILKFPDLNKQFVLTCDASSTGIGCILSQWSDDEKFLHPIAYASNKLTDTQSKWSAGQREFYALKFYCQKFKQYLLGRKFLVRTDNQALVNWQSFKDVDNPKLWRWFMTLSNYDFDIKYIPGVKNESDGPSRLLRSNDKNLKNPQLMIPNNISTVSQDDSLIAPNNNNQKNGIKPSTSCTDFEKITQAQAGDKTLQTVISWVKSGNRPKLDRNIQKLNPDIKCYYNSFNRLSIKDGILYRSWERNDNETPDDLICVPQSITTEVIKLCHDIPSGGHLGKPKTLSKIQTRFYWPKMKLEVSLYLDACEICIKKSQKQKPKSPLNPFNGQFPNDIVSMDLMENLPDNPKKYRSILVIVDRFTCWVEAFPLKDTKATTIARTLLDGWITRMGCPIQLHSDRGPQLTSEVIKITCDLMNIHKSFTTAYRPMSDGGAEAAVKIVKNLLRGFCYDKPQQWPDLLQQCLFAYRTSKHSSTGYSPFFLHRGHSPRIPMDILLGTFNHKQFKNQQEYAYNLFKTLKDTYNHVEEKLNQTREFAKTKYDKRAKVVQFEPGQFVYVWRPRPPHIKNKFFNHFYGPYRIIKKITEFTYKIDVGKSRMHDVVPHDLLRLAPDNQLNTHREYQAPLLDFEHTLEIIPELPEQEQGNTQLQPVRDDRPITFIQENTNNPIILNDNPPENVRQMTLRDRNALRPPDYFQAGQ